MKKCFLFLLLLVFVLTGFSTSPDSRVASSSSSVSLGNVAYAAGGTFQALVIKNVWYIVEKL